MTLTGLLVLISYSAGCLLAVARHPIYGLSAYVLIFYLNPPARWWGQGFLEDIRWSLLAAAFTFVGVLIHTRGRSADPFFRKPVITGFCLFIVWLAIQLVWAIDVDKQLELIEYYVKFLLATYLVYRAIDSETHLRWFLWSHVFGCFYFGWIVYTSHAGGRFDDFGGAGIKDANEAALTLGTATLVIGSLLLVEQLRNKIVSVGVAPFIMNGMVATISRSAFLALLIGGAAYNFFAPRRLRKLVIPLSALGVLLLVLLTNESYWSRMDSLTQKGQRIEGVDTGADRIAQWKGQIQIFRDHPLGCGHQCTTALSVSYFDTWVLDEKAGVRASHNTFLSMLVDHGFVGAVMYLALFGWTVKYSLALRRRLKDNPQVAAIVLPAIAGGLIAMFVADIFVPYVRYEVRFWYLGVLLCMARFAAVASSNDLAPTIVGTSVETRLKYTGRAARKQAN